MKASNLTVSLLIVIIPAVVLLISGLDQNGLINAGIAAAITQLLNVVLKVLQERENVQQPPPMASSSVPMSTERSLSTPSLLKRVLFY